MLAKCSHFRFGALREINQLSTYIFPRDGATAGLGGYLALYRVTGDKDYLERAELFADWFLRNAINPTTQWPYWSFPLDGSAADASDPVGEGEVIPAANDYLFSSGNSRFQPPLSNSVFFVLLQHIEPQLYKTPIICWQCFCPYTCTSINQVTPFETQP